MGLLGMLVYIVSTAIALYMGYTANFELIILILLPIGFMIGRIILQGNQSATIFRSQGIGIVLEIISFYLVGIILTALFFGIGWGVMEILKLSPEG